MQHKAIQRVITLKADASGNPPTSIHLMTTGHWHAPWHGNFEMTPDDLDQMVANFNAGEATVEGSHKLPINYGHDISGKAAGWVTRIYTQNEGTELWGDVEWTPEGERMLQDGEFKYISPEWNPRSFPYQDPEDEERWIDNVFTGAGLTNIPLFKKLKPIMASRVPGSSVKANQPKGGDMDLEKVRVKKPEELTDDEKAFLEEHKADLSDEERTAFGLEVEPEPTPEPQPSQQASAVNGGLTASQIKQLQADAAAGRAAQQELLKSRLTASVDSAIARGAIKSDQKQEAVDVLMASSETGREKLLSFIKNLPENKLLASEIGDGGTDARSAQDELADRAANVVKESDGKVSYADAIKGVMASDSALRDRVTAERAKN